MALNKKILSLAVTSLFAFTATVGLNSQQAAMAANNPLSTVTAVEIVNGQTRAVLRPYLERGLGL